MIIIIKMIILIINNILFIIMSSKQDIISEAYFDRSGFGSRARTLQEARRKDKSITAEDINEFFKKNLEQKRKPTGQNSFVAPNAYYEFQIDLFLLMIWRTKNLE